jgi:polysaccharide deacetylase family protein (PEP-CTERM system associated)
MINALTVDVEDWYQTNGLDIPVKQWDGFEDRIVGSTMRLLSLLDRHNIKATFFILGCVARKHPRLIKAIDSKGHEIGSHGGWHQLLSRLTLEQFREDLLFSKDVLEQITGKPVVMYRAPSWSIDNERLDYLTQLSECGFTLDSSIQPFRTPLSGMKDAPVTPFYPVVRGQQLSMLEVPTSVLDIKGLRIPFSGGFYLRAMPYAFTAAAMKRLNRTRPAMIYIHPWELDPEMPRLKVPKHIAFVQYYRVASTERKLTNLLTQFKFSTLGELVANEDYPAVRLS